LFAIAFPFVLLASRSADFQAHYPILEISPGQTGVWGDLAIWWPLYALQFVAIEAFFRGVLVLGLAQRFGSSAVFIGVVPYMMIHFVKPPAEAAASVIGGVVLGCLALRTRSIVWGMALHVAIAATMDLAALGHKGFLW
jgi:membrane protease YdiL (CAAX protease family)